MKRTFFKAFLRDWRGIGSVVPSSRFLVRKMLAPIDFGRAKLIVELGPGNGPITRGLLRRMNGESRLIALELNEDFVKRLMDIHDERLVVIHASALDIAKFIRANTADYVISAIPLATISVELQKKLFIEIKHILSEKGSYIQFQYSLRSLILLKRNFRFVATTLALCNIPPAFIYQCKKT